MSTRRPLIVLGVLIGAMTISSALLLALEPGPTIAQPAVSLSSIGLRGETDQPILQTTAPIPPGQWSGIVILESGTESGSAQSLEQDHQRQGLGDLACHFVIGNGQGSGDGQIEVGARWREQRAGNFATGPNRQWFNQHTIGICLVADTRKQPLTAGQTRQLTWLIRQLQRNLNIQAHAVMIHADMDPQVRPGRYLPVAHLRQSLLSTQR